MNGRIDSTKARHINVVGKMGYVTLSATDGRGGSRQCGGYHIIVTSVEHVVRISSRRVMMEVNVRNTFNIIF